MTYRTIDEWLDEVENFATRRDRLLDELGERGLEWVRTAWELGAVSSVYTLKPEAYDAFVKALEAPQKPNARLRSLMQSTPTWEEPANEIEGLLAEFQSVPDRKKPKGLGPCEAISTKMRQCSYRAFETRDGRLVCKVHACVDYPLQYVEKKS